MIRSLIIGIRIRGSKSRFLLISVLLLLTSWIGTAHHHMAGMVSVLSVSSLGCVGDGRCVSAVCILALPIVVLLKCRGIVNIDGFVRITMSERVELVSYFGSFVKHHVS